MSYIHNRSKTSKLKSAVSMWPKNASFRTNNTSVRAVVNPVPSSDSAVSNYSGWETKGPENMKLACASHDTNGSNLDRNTSDDTMIYNMHLVSSRDDIVYNRTSINSHTSFQDKYSYDQNSVEIDTKVSDASVATLPFSPKQRSSVTKPRRTSSPAPLKLSSSSRLVTPCSSNASSIASVPSQGSQNTRPSSTTRQIVTSSKVGRQNYNSPRGVTLSSQSYESSQRRNRTNKDMCIHQNDSDSVYSSRNGTINVSSSIIDKIAAIAVATAATIINSGGTKDAAKAATTAVLSSESNNVPILQVMAPVAAEAGMAVLAAGMSESSAVAVMVMVLKDAEIAGGDEMSSVVSFNVPKLQGVMNTRTNRECGALQPMIVSNESPPSIVTTNKKISPMPHPSPKLDTINCATPRITNLEIINCASHRINDTQDSCQSCTSAPIMSQLSDVIEDTGIAITRSFSDLQDKVITPTSHQIERGVTDLWRDIRLRINSLYVEDDDETVVESRCDQENDTTEVTRSTDIRVGAYKVCVTETADDIEVSAIAAYNSTGETDKVRRIMKRAKRKVGKKIGKLVGKRKGSRQSSESSNQ